MKNEIRNLKQLKSITIEVANNIIKELNTSFKKHKITTLESEIILESVIGTLLLNSALQENLPNLLEQLKMFVKSGGSEPNEPTLINKKEEHLSYIG